MSSVVAPLFAGFALTIGFIVLQTDVARWSDVALSAFVAAAACLGACVQFGFRAKQYAVTPGDIEGWWPNPDDIRIAQIRDEQRLHRLRFKTWADRARWAYNAGLLLLLLGVFLALVPHGPVEPARYVVLVVAAGAFALELTWLVNAMIVKQSISLPELASTDEGSPH
jgi:hypothetical protein